MAKNDQNTSTVQLNVNSSTIIGSQYAQIVGLNISDVDATLEFVYINPQIKGEGQTVARITMPRKAIEELGRIIPETVKKHEDNKKRT